MLHVNLPSGPVKTTDIFLAGLFDGRPTIIHTMSELDLSMRVAVPPILTPTSVFVFGEAIRLASAGPGRAIVLEGSREVFCRGLDIRHFAFRAEKEELLVFASALLALRHATKAVIAIVDGVALGEGIGLAAASDFVIATQD